VLRLSFEEIAERRLNDHGERLRALEIKDATQNAKIDSLCEKLEKLSDDIKALVEFMKAILWKTIGGMGGLLVIFLGFFVWYVQNLAK
jgi:uncharacterized coiled-coil protein SlyX